MARVGRKLNEDPAPVVRIGLTKPNPVAAAERARWLAEMLAELDRASNVLPELILIGGPRPHIIELYARIEAVRAQVRILEGNDRSVLEADIHPKRIRSASEIIWAKSR